MGRHGFKKRVSVPKFDEEAYLVYTSHVSHSRNTFSRNNRFSKASSGKTATFVSYVDEARMYDTHKDLTSGYISLVEREEDDNDYLCISFKSRQSKSQFKPSDGDSNKYEDADLSTGENIERLKTTDDFPSLEPRPECASTTATSDDKGEEQSQADHESQIDTYTFKSFDDNDETCIKTSDDPSDSSSLEPCPECASTTATSGDQGEEQLKAGHESDIYSDNESMTTVDKSSDYITAVPYSTGQYLAQAEQTVVKEVYQLQEENLDSKFPAPKPCQKRIPPINLDYDYSVIPERSDEKKREIQKKHSEICDKDLLSVYYYNTGKYIRTDNLITRHPISLNEDMRPCDYFPYEKDANSSPTHEQKPETEMCCEFSVIRQERFDDVQTKMKHDAHKSAPSLDEELVFHRSGSSASDQERYLSICTSSCHSETSSEVTEILDCQFFDPGTFTNNADPTGPKVSKWYLFSSGSSFETMELMDIIEMWKHPLRPAETSRWQIQRFILSKLIPKLKESENIKDLSRLLAVDDFRTCKQVICVLEGFLLSWKDIVNTEDIAFVEECVWNKLYHEQGQVFRLGLLNLMLWSCFICDPYRQERDLDELRRVSQSRMESLTRLLSSKHIETLSHDIYKSMHHFHQRFLFLLSQKGNLPIGKGVLVACKEDAERHSLVRKAEFCEKICHIYSILKQIQGPSGAMVVSYLQGIFKSLLHKESPRRKHTILMLMVTGCQHALLRGTSTEQDKLAYVIKMTVEETSRHRFALTTTKHQDRQGVQRVQQIVTETNPLLFHISMSVREVVRALHQRCWLKRSPVEFIASEIERELASSSLQIESRFLAEPRGRCFHTLTGRMGSDGVLVHTYVPSIRDLRSDSDISNLFAADQSQAKQHHVNNLELLRKLSPDCNTYITRLYAFKVKPMPFYYVTEKYQETLQHHVLERRDAKKWAEKRDLIVFLMDVTNCLDALHKRNIVLRNFALSNFVLFREGRSVKLADLSLASQYTGQEDSSDDSDCDYIPTRWMSPEVLTGGGFSPQSDMWALGIFITVLWSHVSEPFVEWKDQTTDSIMAKVAFRNLVPYQWECIPKDLYDLALQCFKCDLNSRITLSKFRAKLRQIDDPRSSLMVPEHSPVKDILLMDKCYPEVKTSRNTAPCTGRPCTIRMKALAVHPMSLYQNADLDLRCSTELQVTDGDIKSEDDPETMKQPRDLNTGMAWMSLLDITLCDQADNDNYANLDQVANVYISMCAEVAELVQNLHEKGLVHRNIRAEHFLRNPADLKIQNGCRRHVTKVSSNGVVHDKILVKSSWWLPPETLIQKIYTLSGDVYMWAMLVYQVLQACDLCSNSGGPKHLLCVPFCMVGREKLAEIKYTIPYPDQPNSCPHWLYDLLKLCWNPDRNARPSMAEVVCRLRQKGY